MEDTQSSDNQSSPIWYIGLVENDGSIPADNSLYNAHQNNYDMVAQPITSQHFQKSIQAIIHKHQTNPTHHFPVIPALIPPDSFFAPSESIPQVLALTSPWIDLCSPDPLIFNISQQVFNLEVAYAAFCGIQNIIIPGPYLPDGSIYVKNVAQFARSVNEALIIAPYIQFQILIPMSPFQIGTFGNDEHLSNHCQVSTSSFTSAEPWAAWETWNSIRGLCAYHNRLSTALSIPRTLPSSAIQARWFSEPIKVIALSETVFNPNKYHQPVLTKQHQALVTRYMRLRTTPWIILHDVKPISKPLAGSDTQKGTTEDIVAADQNPHLSYLRAFQSRQPPKPTIEKFGAGYQDYLQMPLQPLTDNLESVTYEVFEKDPVKYELYEQAITQALHDWSTLEKPTSSNDGKVVIAVVGAGRGPLVSRALRASEISGVPVQVWAVEKNPNAYFLLNRTNQSQWNGAVTVVKSDMRAWKGPLHSDGSIGSVDILVSELLGSFGDNELSPECLDGIQRVLAPQYGISIPADYTALLSPISTPKIYADILTKVTPDVQAFDVPYVVMLHSYDFLSYTAPPPSQPSAKASTTLEPNQPLEQPKPLKTPTVLPAWKFDHPLHPSILEQAAIRKGGSAEGGGGGITGGEGSNSHNMRFKVLSFKCPDRGVCHGFAGYFESVLYKPEMSVDDEDEEEENWSVELSTNPLTMDAKSRDMISWFPIFFPLEVPLSFPDQSILEISIWRQTDDRKVWYEWIVESYVETGTSNNQRIRLGATRLHSTRKNGCLM